MITIKIYQNQQGQEPLKEWINGLKDKRTIARIYNRIKRVRIGNLGDYRIIGDELFELRFHFGAGYRIYYGRIGRQIILLLVGGAKASQKKDIQKAKLYWKEYKNYAQSQ